MYKTVVSAVLFLLAACCAVAQGKKQTGLFKHSADTIVVRSKGYYDSLARKRKQDAARRDTIIVVPQAKIVKKEAEPKTATKPTVTTPIKPGIPLTIAISMRQAVVRSIYEIKISLIITNKGYRTQSFLFDRPMRASGGMWAATCTIFDGDGKSVLKYPYNNTPEKKTYTSYELEKFWYTLKPKEWLMKSYDVASLVTFEEKYANAGRLPPGKYYLQLTFQGNPSNVVSFTVR